VDEPFEARPRGVLSAVVSKGGMQAIRRSDAEACHAPRSRQCGCIEELVEHIELVLLPRQHTVDGVRTVDSVRGDTSPEASTSRCIHFQAGYVDLIQVRKAKVFLTLISPAHPGFPLRRGIGTPTWSRTVANKWRIGSSELFT